MADTSEQYIKMWTEAGFDTAPTQDQLQEMSGYTWQEFDLLCLGTAARYKASSILPDIETKEQAGLVVVMLEKHNKVWNGENWKID